MLRFLPVLFLAGVVLEVASIIWVGGLIGVLQTILLLFAGGAVGISLFRSAGTSMMEGLRSPIRQASFQKGLASGALLRVLSGLLFIIPGFFSDFLGLLLLLPPVKTWLSGRMKVHTFSPEERPPQRYERVIDAEAIEISGSLDPVPPDDRKQ